MKIAVFEYLCTVPVEKKKTATSELLKVYPLSQKSQDGWVDLAIFAQGVKQNEDWTLFCPNEAYDPATGKGL